LPEEEEPKRITKKICLLGDPAVGKTSLIHRYVYDVFDDKYLSTIGAKITKKVNMVKMPGDQPDIEVTLLIWDIAGQVVFDNVHHSYYKGAEGVLVVADITRSETFDHVAKWTSETFKVAPCAPVLILANKYDLMQHAGISKAEIEEKIGKFRSSYLFTSAKSGANVERAFITVSEFMAKQSVQQ